ncbi:hypothetical protein ACVWY7_002306 [Bacillus sp. TE9106W]
MDRLAKNTPTKMKQAPIPIVGFKGSPNMMYPTIIAINGETYNQVDGNTGFVFDKSQ